MYCCFFFFEGEWASDVLILQLIPCIVWPTPLAPAYGRHFQSSPLFTVCIEDRLFDGLDKLIITCSRDVVSKKVAFGTRHTSEFGGDFLEKLPAGGQKGYSSCFDFRKFRILHDIVSTAVFFLAPSYYM